MLDEAILYELNKLPENRNTARELKEKFYFDGKCCSKGHLSKKYACNYKCWECQVAEYKCNNLVEIDKEILSYYQDLLLLPKTREEAKRIGSKYYFTRQYCNNSGHISKKLTSNNGCVHCIKEARKKTYKTKPIDRKKWIGIYDEFLKYPKTREEAKEIGSTYYFTGRECKKGHIDRRYTYSKICVKCDNIQRKKKIDSDPIYKLNRSISNAIYNSLKYGKQGKSWTELVDFTFEEFKEHMIKLFTDGMTIENHGTYWHIDHIKPLSLCKSREEGWALSNLQPLKVEDNLKKGNRYIGHPDNPQWVDKKDRIKYEWTDIPGYEEK